MEVRIESMICVWDDKIPALFLEFVNLLTLTTSEGELRKSVKAFAEKHGLDRPWYFKAGYSAVDIIFKPFTVKGEAMAAYMDKTTVIFGRLYGELKRVDMDKPLVLDNSQAHIVLTEF